LKYQIYNQNYNEWSGFMDWKLILKNNITTADEVNKVLELNLSKEEKERLANIIELCQYLSITYH